MTTTETRYVLSVCVDCAMWSQYGADDPYVQLSDCYDGPGQLLRRNVWADLSDSDPHYSTSECEGCGSVLAGDRLELVIMTRGEQ